MTRLALRILVALASVWLMLVPVHAYDDTALVNAEQQLRGLKSDLVRIQGVIGAETVTDEQLADQRGLLEKLRTEANDNSVSLKAPLQEIVQQQERLGPPPENAATELPAIADERKNLATQIAKLNAAQKQFELVQLEADQTLGRVLAAQRSQFLQKIFKADRSVLNPRLWVEAAGGLRLLHSRVSSQLSSWWANSVAGISLAGLSLLPLGLAAVLAARRFALPWLARSLGIAYGPGAATEPETALIRLWRVVSGLLKFTLLYPLLTAVVMASLATAEILSPPIERLLTSVFSGLLPAALNTWIVYLICAPAHPERRLIAVDTAAARTLTVTVGLASLAYGLGDELATIAQSLYVPVTFAIGQSAVSAWLMICLLSVALLVARRQAVVGFGAAETPYFLTWFMRLAPLLWIMLVVALVALFLGFISLSYFITGNLLNSAMLAVVLGVAHAFAHALSTAAADSTSPVGLHIRRLTGLTDIGLARLILFFRTLSDLVLVAIAVPVLVAMWTVTLVDFRSAMTSAANGIQIGNIVLSPSALAAAFAVMAIGIILTRFITGWLQERVLSATRLDTGVQDSVRTGARYAGYTFAAALALSAAGLDFSTLAIIAGALGVGIGFGLQSIVNNFISGLILLAERPIRVGDWIVTASGEGIVKRINVRATELETFDSCSVIVPNLNLITAPVRNWTLRNSTGRFTVTVGVAYGSNADDVVKALLELAAAHPKVLNRPVPNVMLLRLAPHAMEFELGGMVRNVFDAAAVASDLRLAIVRTFAKKKLAILPSVEVVRPT